MIRLEDVDKRFDGRLVLDGVNLHVKPGTITTIAGATGAGKSLLVRIMVGLERPEKGSVVVDGQNLVTATPSRLGRVLRRTGVMLEEPALLDHLTLGENVAFPLRVNLKLTEKEIQDVVLERLGEVGLLGEEDRYPRDMPKDALKRVSLARALALDPSILILDQPSAGLDPAEGWYLDHLLLRLHAEAGLTCVMMREDLHRAFDYSDEIFLMYRGKVISHGVPADIRRDPDHLIQRYMERSLGGPTPVR